MSDHGSKMSEACTKGFGLGWELVACGSNVAGHKAINTTDAMLTLYNGRCLLKCCCAQ